MSGATRAGDARWSGELADAERPPFRRLVVLAAIAVLLGVVTAVTVLPGLAPPVPTRAGEPLVALDAARVREVEVRPHGGTPYRFVRGSDGWSLVAGAGSAAVPVPADRLDGFLATVTGLTRLVEIGSGEVDLAEFGLAPPRAEVVIRDGSEARLALGDRNPPLTALYVQVLPRTNIVLVGAVLLWEFDKLVALARAHSVEP